MSHLPSCHVCNVSYQLVIPAVCQTLGTRPTLGVAGSAPTCCGLGMCVVFLSLASDVKWRLFTECPTLQPCQSAGHAGLTAEPVTF